MSRGKFLLTSLLTGIKQLFFGRSRPLPAVKETEEGASGNQQKQSPPYDDEDDDFWDQSPPLIHYWSNM